MATPSPAHLRDRCRAASIVLAATACLAPAPAAAADDLAPLSDEFDDASTFADWQDLGVVEGWVTPSFEQADIDTTEPGRFHIVPGALTWFNHLRGLLFFKEVAGDFVATTRLRVLSRHDPGDPTAVPNRSFSLAGLFVHAPRPVTRAAPVPYTTDAVWPPDAFGSDYLPNTENYLFLSFGTAGNPGTRQFEIKATRDSVSRLYFAATGIDQGEAEAWLQVVRVGETFVCLRRHAAEGDWIVENRYPNADHPLPVFGSTLQVGLTAYTDWPTAAPFSAAGLEASYHFNYAPPLDGQPDLVARVDYFRIRRPDPGLTEAVLQSMAVSYDPAANATANPPVLLSASPAAGPFLGDAANRPFDPYDEWRQARFGDEAPLPLADPGTDADGDGVPNGIEFALEGDPLDATDAPRPTLSPDAATTTITLTPGSVTGLRLEIHQSSDLDNWIVMAARPSPGAPWTSDVPGVSIEVDPASGQVTVTIPSPGGRGAWRLVADW